MRKSLRFLLKACDSQNFQVPPNCSITQNLAQKDTFSRGRLVKFPMEIEHPDIGGRSGCSSTERYLLQKSHPRTTRRRREDADAHDGRTGDGRSRRVQQKRMTKNFQRSAEPREAEKAKAAECMKHFFRRNLACDRLGRWCTLSYP